MSITRGFQSIWPQLIFWLLHISHTHFSIFSPLKIIEYMAMGKPIIGSSLGQISELLQNNCGLLVEPNNESGIASAINLLLKEPDQAKLFGKKRIKPSKRSIYLET